MKLLELKSVLEKIHEVAFQLHNGELIPSHFHVTEVGKVTKNFIDCGGTIRKEEVVSFQLWSGNDLEHRLYSETFLKIIEKAETVLGVGNHKIEVEYQANTIGKYGLDFNGTHFVLTTKQTDCLAMEKCEIPTVAKGAAENKQLNSCSPSCC